MGEDLIKKVYFISDYYRSRQERNVKILFGLISPIFMNSGVEAEILPNTEQYVDEKKWVETLNGGKGSVLENYDLNESVIIGFEINPADKNYLNEHDISWINIEIHPIRFLEDLHFSVTASFPFDFDSLSRSEKHIQLAANVLRLKNLECSYDIEENALIIIGQTPADKSVYFDGEFKSLIDYVETLEELCTMHNAVYYRPHPVETDNKVAEEIIRRFDAKTLSDISYYDLLSADQVKTVCGISSSSLHEAKYFHKNIVFLEKRIKEFSRPISLQSLLECNELWFDSLLSVDSRKMKKEKFDLLDNLCRDLYGYWSYETRATIASATAQEANAIAKEAGAKADIAYQALNSTSWRMTEPLRELRAFIQKK